MFRIRIKKQENPKGILLKSNTVEITHTVKGADGADGQSAYDLWLAQGNTGSEADFLASLKGADGRNGVDGRNGADGQSAYDLWLALGNTGSEADFLASLKGADGKNGADGKDGKDADQTQINQLQQQVDKIISDMNYAEIAIKEFTNNINTVEKGTEVTFISLMWSLNKTPEKVVLYNPITDRNDEQAPSQNGGNAISLTKSLDKDTTFRLDVTDERGATDTESTSIKFYNGLYYGFIDVNAIPVDESTGEFNATDDILRQLLLSSKVKKVLQTSKSVKETTLTPETEQRIIYAIPKSYGTPTFKTNGFSGGLKHIATFAFTNGTNNHTEDYNVWVTPGKITKPTTFEVI